MNRFAIAQPASFDEAARLLTDGRFRLPVLKAGRRIGGLWTFYEAVSGVAVAEPRASRSGA